MEVALIAAAAVGRRTAVALSQSRARRPFPGGVRTGTPPSLLTRRFVALRRAAADLAPEKVEEAEVDTVPVQGGDAKVGHNVAVRRDDGLPFPSRGFL